MDLLSSTSFYVIIMFSLQKSNFITGPFRKRKGSGCVEVWSDQMSQSRTKGFPCEAGCSSLRPSSVPAESHLHVNKSTNEIDISWLKIQFLILSVTSQQMLSNSAWLMLTFQNISHSWRHSNAIHPAYIPQSTTSIVVPQQLRWLCQVVVRKIIIWMRTCTLN